jgi:hypothetical protein
MVMCRPLLALLISCCTVAYGAELLVLPAGWTVRESGPRSLIAWHAATSVEILATFERNDVTEDRQDGMAMRNRTGMVAWANEVANGAAAVYASRQYRALPKVDPWVACLLRSHMATQASAMRKTGGKVVSCMESDLQIQFRHGRLYVLAFCVGDIPTATQAMKTACGALKPAPHLHTLGADPKNPENDGREIATVRAALPALGDTEIIPWMYGADTELRPMPAIIPEAYRGDVKETADSLLLSRYTATQHIGVHPQRGGGNATIESVIGVFRIGAAAGTRPERIVVMYKREKGGMGRSTELLSLLPDGRLLRHFVDDACVSFPRIFRLERSLDTHSSGPPPTADGR